MKYIRTDEHETEKLMCHLNIPVFCHSSILFGNGNLENNAAQRTYSTKTVTFHMIPLQKCLLSLISLFFLFWHLLLFCFWNFKAHLERLFQTPSHLSVTLRDRWSAGIGDSGCFDEPADISTTSAAPLCVSAESNSRPQPAEPRSPAALLAPPPQPALHGCQPADLPTARSV